MWALKVTRSTMAREAGVGEHGSPFTERQVRPDGDGGSFLPFGDDLEQQFGAARVELDIAKLAEQEQVQAAVAADDAGQLPVVGGFSELVDQLGSDGVADPAALLAACQAQADEQVRLATSAPALQLADRDPSRRPGRCSRKWRPRFGGCFRWPSAEPTGLGLGTCFQLLGFRPRADQRKLTGVAAITDCDVRAARDPPSV